MDARKNMERSSLHTGKKMPPDRASAASELASPAFKPATAAMTPISLLYDRHCTERID
jgi:hypothetical protein